MVYTQGGVYARYHREATLVYMPGTIGRLPWCIYHGVHSPVYHPVYIAQYTTLGTPSYLHVRHAKRAARQRAVEGGGPGLKGGESPGYEARRAFLSPKVCEMVGDSAQSCSVSP